MERTTVTDDKRCFPTLEIIGAYNFSKLARQFHVIDEFDPDSQSEEQPVWTWISINGIDVLFLCEIMYNVDRLCQKNATLRL